MTNNPAGDDDSDYELDPTFPVDPEVTSEAKGAVENVNSRIVGYHFAGLSFYPGRNGVRSLFVGDPGIQGMISVKVVYTGTGKRNSIFTVPIQLMVIEEEELAIAIAGA